MIKVLKSTPTSKSKSQSKSQRLKFAAIALVAIVLLTLGLAPSRDRLSSGSTYSRSPNGYGAWYAFMEQRGTPIKRWQRPLSALENQPPITLLRVRGTLTRSPLDRPVDPWVEQGHTIVTLGVWQDVTEAPFTSEINSPQGKVKIETTRRASLGSNDIELLGDRFGAVAWVETQEKGRKISVTTPYLGANAYQDEPGNYEFLAELLAATNQPIWVDEYIHGYRDADAEDKAKVTGNWWLYLAKTPLLLVVVQGAIIFIVAIAAQNRRFGQAEAIDPPQINNSESYIKALASVLRKAESSEFLIHTISKAEQLALQESLGLGSTLLSPEDLITAWQTQTGRDASELKFLLQAEGKPRVLSEAKLRIRLAKWQAIRK